MSNVHPLVSPRGARGAAEEYAAARAAERAQWLAVCEVAWADYENATPDDAALDAVRDAHEAALASGDEFATAAAEVVLLADVARRGDLAEAVAGMVPTLADLETFPVSVWGARAESVLADCFADLSETALAIEHSRRRQSIAEALDDLVLQADAVSAIAQLLAPGPERLDALNTAEALYARASVDSGVDSDADVRGSVAVRYLRAVTNLDLGLVADAAEQLPALVDVARSIGSTHWEATALASLAVCRGESGEAEPGVALARDAVRLAADLEPRERLDVELRCAQAFGACGRPDMTVGLLDTPRVTVEADPGRREAALTVLAAAFHRLGQPERAYASLRAADVLRRRSNDEAGRVRVEAMRAYHRSRVAERELTSARDLAAPVLDQIASIQSYHGGAPDLAVRDEATGLPNRRYLDLELRWRCSQRLPANGVLGLTLVTIDDFDAIAAHGHSMGDLVVHLVGQVLRGNVRGGDAVARFGADTFAVVQFHRSPDAMRYSADRLLAAVRTYPWSEEGVSSGITVSVGATALTPPTTPGALVSGALAAVGKVAAAGGDGVECSARTGRARPAVVHVPPPPGERRRR